MGCYNDNGWINGTAALWNVYVGLDTVTDSCDSEFHSGLYAHKMNVSRFYFISQHFIEMKLTKKILSMHLGPLDTRQHFITVLTISVP